MNYVHKNACRLYTFSLFTTEAEPFIAMLGEMAI